MSAIKPHEADRFVAAPPAAVRAILCYGPDAGLVSERARAAAQAFLKGSADPFALTKLSADDIAGDTARIADEICSVALFGGKRCVWLRPEARDISKALSGVADAIDGDTLLVVEAGNLKPSSPLRKLFEQRKDWAAIACYSDGERDLGGLIDATVAEAGLSIDKDARTFLLGHLGGDRLASRMEVEKLCLYARGRGSISLADTAQVIGDVSSLEMDDMLDAMGVGDLATLDRLVQRMLAAGTAHAQIVAAAIRHFCLLHELRSEIDAGKSARAAVEGARPPIFFKRRDIVVRQCDGWSLHRLDQALERLHEGERLSRTGDLVARAGVVQALLDVAIRAPR